MGSLTNDQFIVGKEPPNTAFKGLRSSAIALLATGKTIAQAADELGISRATVGQWAHIEKLRLQAAAPKAKREVTPAPYARGFRWGDRV